MEEFKIKNYTVRIVGPQILEGFIHERAVLDGSDFRNMKALHEKICNGLPYSILLHQGFFASLSAEFMTLSAEADKANLTLARGLMVPTLGHRIAGNFYINVNRPIVKTRLFTKRKDALKWLKRQNERLNTSNKMQQ